MIKKLSIRSKLIVSILIGCLVPFFIGSLYIKDQTEKWLFENNVEHTQIILQQTAEYVDESILNHMQNFISMIAMDERIIAVDPDINKYLDYNATDFVFKETESEREITAFFKSIVETHELVSFVSYGTEQGGYIEYPTFKPTAPYDPRVRGWYTSTLKSESSIVSEPYETKVTKELVISVNKVVKSNDKNIGVVNMTIGLDKLMHEISAIPYGKTGYINILSPSKIFINSPENPEWLLKSSDAIGIDTFKNIDQFNGNYFEGQLDGIDKVFNVFVSPNSGWRYVSVIDKTEILEKSNSLTGLLMFIFLFTAIIIVIFVWIISTYITKPILKMAQIITKMATFKFDAYERKDLKEYSNHNDEIGEISRALTGMQDNFVELKNTIATLDDEIQSITIDDTSIHQLSLSTNNPFANITSSINVLLRKVYDYVGQINEFNEEISSKNDQLSASEEELIAQLDEINIQKEKIYFLADHDPLTNLPNRRSFHQKLSHVISNRKKGAVILLDMDNFKSINDTLGHIFGDRVLQGIADNLQLLSAPNIFVSRFGGDEFLILYECDDDMDSLRAYIDELYLLFNQLLLVDDNEIKVEFSMGISVFPNDSDEIEQIIMNADLALYEAKRCGKNGYTFFNDALSRHLKYKIEVKSILMHALENDGFKMVYQPQVCLKTGAIIGFEALIRLKDHNISPADFIQIAEGNGIIIPIGRRVTQLVIEQINVWNQKGFVSKPVAINFSALQINDTSYKTYLLELLTRYHVKPENIVIEITEHVFLENKEATISFMNELKALGVKIAVDDFGTEYSSLSYLAALPIDTLKFDRDLNLRLLALPNKEVIENLIAFVHSLNLNVIAEGIEEFEHVQKLFVGNCDIIQGYYFSKPLEVVEVEAIYDKIYKID